MQFSRTFYNIVTSYLSTENGMAMVTLNVLYQSDNNYSKYMGVSILSMLENNKDAEDILVIIIDDRISQSIKDEISSIVKDRGRRLQWIDADAIRENTIVSEWPKYEGFRKNTNCYLKYFIFDGMLDEGIERVMYVDSDSVVLGSLGDLFTLDMQGKAIGMARCCLVPRSYLESTGVGSDSPYFNAGMNLFDVKKWNEKQYSKKIIEAANTERPFATVDQDLLNIVTRGDVIDIGCQYNYQYMHVAYPHPVYLKHYKPLNYYSCKEVEDATKDPKIVHFMRFLGENPWNERSNHPCAGMYDEYLSMTPWKGDKKPPSNKTASFRVGRAMYKVLPRAVFLKIFKKYHERMLLKSDANAKRIVKK